MPSCISSHLSDTFKSNNTKMLSSKSFIRIFKATESPFNMVLLRDTSIAGQQLRVHHPKPQKANRDGINCTFPDTSSHSQPHKQIWESVCLHGWGWNMESEFPLHLWITRASLAPFCHQNTRSWCSGSFPLGVPSEHPTVTWLSKKIPFGHTDNCLGTFPILVCTAERTEQSNASSAELQLNSTKFCQGSHPAWA